MENKNKNIWYFGGALVAVVLVVTAFFAGNSMGLQGNLSNLSLGGKGTLPGQDLANQVTALSKKVDTLSQNLTNVNNVLNSVKNVSDGTLKTVSMVRSRLFGNTNYPNGDWVEGTLDFGWLNATGYNNYYSSVIDRLNALEQK